MTEPTAPLPRERRALLERAALGCDAGEGDARCAASPRRGLRVADVALFYGERSGGIRTYLDAKAACARDRRVRAPRGRAGPRASVTRRARARAAVAAPGACNGYRWPIGVGAAGRPAARAATPTSCCCTTRSGRRCAVRAARTVGAGS